MFLIPKPKTMIRNKGQFNIKLDTTISIEPQSTMMNMAMQLKSTINHYTGIDVALHPQKSNAFVFSLKEMERLYRIEISENGVLLESSELRGLFYALQTLKQIIQQNGRRLPYMVIEDEPVFENRGYYYDVTRGKVPTLETLKSIADIAASFKLNQLQLYVEHTFLYPNQSEVWTVTDPLTAEDIMAFDDYCAERYIELVPSISTFGHLYEALQTESYGHLSELEPMDGFSWVDRMNHHTLDVNNEESLEFVKNMIDAFIPLVRSRKFNICADETFDLGEGKNKVQAESFGKSKLYVLFLTQIIQHVQSYGKEVMFWGDIILKHPEEIGQLPKDITCLNWWYWLNYPAEKVSKIAENGFKQYLCPGVNGWNTLMNNHKMAYDNIRLMTDYGIQFKAAGILNTDWGDYGHWNAFACSIPGLIYGAAFSWGEDRSFEALNDAINRVFFDTDDDVLKQLITLSDVHYFTLLPLVRYLEKGLTDYLERVTVDALSLKKSKAVIEECINQLIDALGRVPKEKRKYIHDYIVSAQGILLLNELYEWILYVENQSTDKIEKSAVQLAIDFETWFLEFKKTWLRDQKPSELYRIRSFIQKIAVFLRKINK